MFSTAIVNYENPEKTDGAYNQSVTKKFLYDIPLSENGKKHFIGIEQFSNDEVNKDKGVTSMSFEKELPTQVPLPSLSHLSQKVRPKRSREMNVMKGTSASFMTNTLSSSSKTSDSDTRYAVMHSCSICNKSFKSAKTLESHMTVHCGDKPFVCAVCLSAFNRRDKLRRHLLSHDPLRNFRCDLCDGTFKRKDKLKRHMAIHNPEKEFKCPYRLTGGCLREFNRADKLKLHLKRVHEKQETHEHNPIRKPKAFQDNTKITS